MLPSEQHLGQGRLLGAGIRGPPDGEMMPRPGSGNVEKPEILGCLLGVVHRTVGLIAGRFIAADIDQRTAHPIVVVREKTQAGGFAHQPVDIDRRVGFKVSFL